MAALEFGGPALLHAHEAPRPEVGPHDVLVQIHAAALNAADLKVLGRRDGAMFLHARELPAIPGYDLSGVVVEAGPRVEHLTTGDEVFGFLPYARTTRGGTCAELVTVDARTLAKKPRSVAHAHAAAVATTGSWALEVLRDVRAGSRVLLHGASGGLGSHAIQIAKLLGAAVTATASAAKLDHVRALGADLAIDYAATPLHALASGGYDVIADLATATSFGACSRLLARGGLYVPSLPSSKLVGGMLRALFTSKRVRFVVAKPRPSDLERLAAWLADGTLSPAIERSYPLAELPAALARLQAGGVRGKLVVELA